MSTMGLMSRIKICLQKTVSGLDKCKYKTFLYHMHRKTKKCKKNLHNRGFGHKKGANSMGHAAQNRKMGNPVKWKNRGAPRPPASQHPTAPQKEPSHDGARHPGPDAGKSTPGPFGNGPGVETPGSRVDFFRLLPEKSAVLPDFPAVLREKSELDGQDFWRGQKREFGASPIKRIGICGKARLQTTPLYVCG